MYIVENYVYFVFPSTNLQVRESASRRVRPSPSLGSMGSRKPTIIRQLILLSAINYVYDSKIIPMIAVDLTDIRGFSCRCDGNSMKVIFFLYSIFQLNNQTHNDSCELCFLYVLCNVGEVYFRFSFQFLISQYILGNFNFHFT